SQEGAEERKILGLGMGPKRGLVGGSSQRFTSRRSRSTPSGDRRRRSPFRPSAPSCDRSPVETRRRTLARWRAAFSLARGGPKALLVFLRPKTSGLQPRPPRARPPIDTLVYQCSPYPDVPAPTIVA